MKVIIVEDEFKNIEYLKSLILENHSDLKILGIADDVKIAIDLINTHTPDLVFLDIQLKTGSGFDIIDAIKNRQFEIIFTTAFEEYAIKAIKLSSIDYLLKPINEVELNNAIDRARIKTNEKAHNKRLDLLLNNLTLEKVSNSSKICLATSDQLEFVNIDDILYCEANGSYTCFYLINNRKILVSKHLKEYENLLGSNKFMRVHNSFLINLKKVKKYVKSDGGYIVMENDAIINISASKKNAFIERMK